MVRGQWIDIEIVTFYTIIAAAIIFLMINSILWVPLNTLEVSKNAEDAQNYNAAFTKQKEEFQIDKKT